VGSYLSGKVIQDALTPYFGMHPNGIELIYAVKNMSGAFINQLIASLQ